MVKHIVMWKCDDAAAKAKIKADLEALTGVVPELISAEVGLSDTGKGYDICLTATLASMDDLAAYQINPDHCKVKDYINTVVTDRAVCDYEI